MGFIKEYVSLAETVTEAPSIFHERMALVILSMAVKRNCWIVQSKRIFPNIWMILLAPSGWYRKSTSVEFALDLIKEIPDTAIIPNEFSHEGLIERLSNNPHGLLWVDEFKTFMNILSRDYMSATKGFLNYLYSNPKEYTREIKGKDHARTGIMKTTTISEPFISFASSTTFDWLKESLASSDVTGGFLSRFIIARAYEKGSPMPLRPETEYQESQSWFVLKEKLSAISQKKGLMQLSPKSKEMYCEWYIKFSQNTDKYITQSLIRLADYAFKIAMLYQLSERNGLLIEPESLEYATDTCDAIAAGLREVMDDLNMNDKEKITAEVEKYIVESTAGKITITELLRKFRKVDAWHMKQIITTLLESERIEQYDHTNGSRQKKVCYKPCLSYSQL